MGQALYRKYRSKSLDELVGQEHITTTLKNALKAGRISHAYLLTGPRGVGKTSIARILAHEINGLPYDDEAHLDIIEIDAASNRRIDEIRDLRDRVNTAPSVAKYKVYIIDEVHMLTKEAFNALLKTLEEPPAHVVFILATTEVHKLPETIISRTQHYSLRLIPEDKVVAHLRTIADGEKIQIDDAALTLIAQHGGGSFRDSTSLLDQASSTADHITRADVERILGLAPDEHIGQLAVAVNQGDSARIVTTLAELYALGHEAAMLTQQLSARLRAEVLAGQAANPHASLALLQKLLDVPGARSPKQLLELILLQASLPPQTTQPAPVLAPPASTPRLAPTPVADAPKSPETPAVKPAQETSQTPPESQSTPEATTSLESTPTPSVVVSTEAERSSPQAPKDREDLSIPPDGSSRDDGEGGQPGSDQTGTTEADPSSDLDQSAGSMQTTVDITEVWQQTLDEIKKQYNTLYGIARMAQPEFDGNKLTLIFKFAFHQKRLNEAKNRQIFADVLERLYGSPVEIACIVGTPTESTGTAGAKPDVSAISNIFGGAELLES